MIFAWKGYHKPQSVYEEMMKQLQNAANPGRSGHFPSLRAAEALEGVREKIKRRFNAENAQVIFTCNCTEALNYAILGWLRKFKNVPSKVICTAYDHNSVLRPVMQLQKKGFISLSVARPEEGKITAEQIDRLWKKDTWLVCLSHASNVTGTRQDVGEVGRLVRQRNALLLTDCAQSAGYFPLDMQRECVDMAAIGGHKGLHGIQGCGCLCFNEESKPKPIIFGGTGSQSNLLLQPKDSPDCFEAGTLNTPAILALGEAIEWHSENGKNNHAQIELVANTVKEGLKEIPDVHIMSLKNPSGIVSFRIGDSSSDKISDILSEQYGIAVRSGLHCAPLCHKLLGTEKTGLVRVSVSGQNTLKEAYIFLNAIEHIAKNLRSR